MQNSDFVYSGSQKSAILTPIVVPTLQAQQELQDFSSGTAIAPCPSCGSTRISLVRMPEYATHYAAQRCGQCDFFRGWEPAPRNHQKRQRRETQIAALLLSDQLSDWEREFLESLRGKRSLSPKQQEVLTRIGAKVGGQH